MQHLSPNYPVTFIHTQNSCRALIILIKYPSLEDPAQPGKNVKVGLLKNNIESTGGPKNWTFFYWFVVPVHDGTERRSTYQNVQFFMFSKSGVLHMTTFKYSCHNVGETTLQ